MVNNKNSKYTVHDHKFSFYYNEEKQIVVVDPNAVSFDTTVSMALIQISTERNNSFYEILLSIKHCNQKIANLFIGKPKKSFK